MSSGRIVVLMYHGLYADDRELAEIDAADRPYAVSLAQFKQQLDALSAAGIPLVDPRQLTLRVPERGGVVLSFDDGHGSNHSHALPELLSRQARAVFFATSDFIERRRGFCTWRQLREMADAGMTIGSHGRTHRFFDDMADDEARAEFIDSRRAIEQHVGHAVDQISFPGGRHTRAQLQLGHDAGYKLLHTSTVGSHAARPFLPGAALARVAIKGGLPLQRFMDLAMAKPAVMLPAQAKAAAKQGVRRVLGNRLYHALYERVAG
jgi:peptidoglycan/xylan/chitin deacetylase (PgdA/CDA1 family)